MSRTVGFPVALVGIAWSLATGVAAQDAERVDAQMGEQMEKGRAVFDTWCAACHRGERPGSIALRVLYQGARPEHLEERTDLVPELTRFFVRNGVSIMPPFRKTEITDEELDALAAYLAPR